MQPERLGQEGCEASESERARGEEGWHSCPPFGSLGSLVASLSVSPLIVPPSCSLSLTLTSFSPRVLSLPPTVSSVLSSSFRISKTRSSRSISLFLSFSFYDSLLDSFSLSLSRSTRAFVFSFPFSLSLSRYNKSEKSPLFLPFVPLLSQGSVTGASAGDAEGGKGGSVASSIAAAVPPEKEDGRMLRKALAALA